ncbi:hypothetical protein [Streptococcus hyovaginalis]|nr:hypothetical protein [Streptococcus hyovaginalis]
MRNQDEISTEELLKITGGAMVPWHDNGIKLSSESSIDAVLK